MDFFPLTVYRFLSRTYSVMSVRNKICLEMIVTLDSLVASGESISSTYGLSDPGGKFLTFLFFSFFYFFYSFHFFIFFIFFAIEGISIFKTHLL